MNRILIPFTFICTFRYIDPSPFVDSLGLDTAQQQVCTLLLLTRVLIHSLANYMYINIVAVISQHHLSAIESPPPHPLFFIHLFPVNIRFLSPELLIINHLKMFNPVQFDFSLSNIHYHNLNQRKIEPQYIHALRTCRGPEWTFSKLSLTNSMSRRVRLELSFVFSPSPEVYLTLLSLVNLCFNRTLKNLENYSLLCWRKHYHNK